MFERKNQIISQAGKFKVFVIGADKYPRSSKQCHVCSMLLVKGCQRAADAALGADTAQESPGAAFLCSCTSLALLVVMNLLSPCHNQSKHPVPVSSIFCIFFASQSWEILKMWHSVYTWYIWLYFFYSCSSFFVQRLIEQNCEEQKSTICFCSTSHSLHSPLSAGYLGSGPLISERGGVGWRLQRLGCSLESLLIYTIWVGWQHFSHASSSQSDKLP